MKKIISLPLRLALAGAAVVLLNLPAMAAANSLEERLRAQLRATAQELQTLQGQYSRAEAARVAAESQQEAAQREIARLRSQLERATQSGEQLRQNATRQIEARNDQLAQFRGAYEELLEIARGKEAERLALQNTLGAREQQLVMCSEKNAQLYDAARDVLAAYEAVTVRDVLRTRQPFAAAARVRFDNLVQQHGDALYEGRFDPRMQPQAAGQSAPDAGASDGHTGQRGAAHDADQHAAAHGGDPHGSHTTPEQ